MTYFFLETPPTTSNAGAGWTRLRSDAGNTYDCRVVGELVSFSWRNKSGKNMESHRTTWKLDGDELVVTTDVQTVRFERAGDSVRTLK
ncbi:hypothetical protein [Ensifer adhaerens]|uniref:hypothetical protein n=1 Tax=Ensifer adhaerens TaxID=106592 RepID=UPI000CF118F7|nr:hypothetical protein [Ensifer adhaerens]